MATVYSLSLTEILNRKYSPMHQKKTTKGRKKIKINNLLTTKM
jgi:hypothetical protein